MKPRVILITGPPRSGKTTLMMKLVKKLPQETKAAGFYTEEIRERGERKGFKLVSLTGQESVLSHADFKSRHRVGKYRVDIEGFEKFLNGISFEGADVAVIDEIGKMEVMSARFRGLIKDLLASDKTVIATIGLKGDSFMEEIRRAPGTRLISLSPDNRDEVLEEMEGLLGK